MTNQSHDSALAIQDEQKEFSNDQLVALRTLGVENASREELAVFFHTCVRTGLDPFARQIYMIRRKGKQTIQTGIDGFRLIANRTTERTNGTLGYEDPQWCGEDGVWRDVWLSKEPPAASRCVVVRNGGRFPAVALYHEYVGLKSDGKPNAMWATKPALMLQKCAAALALRSAFPHDLSGLYTSDEMQQAGNPLQTAPAAPQRHEPPRVEHPDGFDQETCSYDELMTEWKRANAAGDYARRDELGKVGSRRFPKGGADNHHNTTEATSESEGKPIQDGHEEQPVIDGMIEGEEA